MDETTAPPPPAPQQGGEAVTAPAVGGDERTSLLGFLQRQRDLVAWKLAGADDDALRAVLTPSGMGALGIVKHLTNVERSWLRDVFAGEAGLRFDWSDDDPDGDLRVGPHESAADLLAVYAAESARCDAAVAGAELGAIAARRGVSLRWILLHLVEETARHLGHLDLLREQADGAVGEDPTG